MEGGVEGMGCQGGADISFPFPEHNSATVRNILLILLILGGVIEQVNAECDM